MSFKPNAPKSKPTRPRSASAAAARPVVADVHRKIVRGASAQVAELLASLADEPDFSSGVVLVIAVGGDPLAESLLGGAGQALAAGQIALVPMTRDEALDVLAPAVALDVQARLRAVAADGPPVVVVIQGGRASTWSARGEALA